jgi:hypothetical protein
MANADITRADGSSIDSHSALRSTFAFTRRARPPSKKALDSDGRVPLTPTDIPPRITRKESKGGIRGIFTRNKTEVDPRVSPISEDFVPQGRPRSPPPKPGFGNGVEPPAQKSFLSFPARKSAVIETYSREPSSLKTAGSKSTNSKSTKTNTKSIAKQSPRMPRRTDAAWDPPPLFQAYPQAIKHALLSASTLSADSIIRLNAQKPSGSVREDAGLGATDEQTAASNKTEKVKIKHRRQISGSITKADWTQKIYVLVTSGYLLQYSGEGSFDRLPEKMMQLGKDSVAFASDVIPGKHWVLQISQAMDADGTPAPDARSLLSRLTFRGADYRRTATSLLLILQSAEDMESWLTTVRREIESLGGKTIKSETGKPKVDETVPSLNSRPSHRYLVHRDSDRISNPASPSPQTLSFKAPWNRSSHSIAQEPIRPDSSATAHSTIGPAADRLSIATSITSDGQHLDSLRESSYRLSYMSSGQRTLVTSRGSSPVCSPSRDTFHINEEKGQNELMEEEVRLRPNGIAISERRRSVQTLQNPTLEYQPVPKGSRQRPHSTYTASTIGSRNNQSHLQPIPNFSVPHTAFKRSSLMRASDNKSLPNENSVRTPAKSKELPLMSVRKSPPAPIQVRSLSPVEEPSPKSYPAVYNPTESSLQKLNGIRPATVESFPRTETGSQGQISPGEFSPDLTLNARITNVSDIDFQFPKRNSVHLGFLESSAEAPVWTAGSPPSPPVDPVESEVNTLPPLPKAFPFELEEAGDEGVTALINEAITNSTTQTPNKIHQTRRPASMQTLSNTYLRSVHKPQSEGPASPSISKIFPPANGTLTPISLRSQSPYTRSGSSTPVNHPKPLPTPPPFSPSLISPSLQRLKSYSAAKQPLANRRSMPQLMNGPPTAPPPNCALPPLPGVSEKPPGTLRTKRSSVRNTMRVR